MVYSEDHVAQATAVIGFDIADGKFWQESDRDRFLTKVGLVGSAVIGDCEIEISFGTQKLAELWNSSIGLSVKNDTDLKTMQSGYVLKAGVPIHVKVLVQPTTNAIAFACELRELPIRRGYASMTPSY